MLKPGPQPPYSLRMDKPGSAQPSPCPKASSRIAVTCPDTQAVQQPDQRQDCQHVRRPRQYFNTDATLIRLLLVVLIGPARGPGLVISY